MKGSNQKRKLVPVLCILISQLAFAQDDYFNPKNFYKFSDDLETEVAADTSKWKYEMGAMKYSISGYHKKALETWDKNPGGRQMATHADSTLFKSLKQVSAKNYILQRSKSEQIVIINEAHHNAMHRWFTSSLLQGLYDNGYRYFGMEALNDSAINERRSPVLSSGFYVKEPEFGNLIIEALRIGFTLFGYEVMDDRDGKEREIGQAKNIVEFMKTHKDGKLLLHAGFGHIYETEIEAWEKAMAGRLKEYTGFDPLTIDQESFSEKSSVDRSHPFVSMINQKEAVVLINKNDQVFNGLTSPAKTDIVVIHPVTLYKNGRPSWLANDRKPYNIPATKISSTPMLALAYREGEYLKTAVPADIIEITERSAAPLLYLKPGKYQLILQDKQQKVVDQYSVIVE